MDTRQREIAFILWRERCARIAKSEEMVIEAIAEVRRELEAEYFASVKASTPEPDSMSSPIPNGGGLLFDATGQKRDPPEGRTATH